MTVNPANVTRIETLLRTDLSVMRRGIARGSDAPGSEIRSSEIGSGDGEIGSEASQEMSATKSLAVDRAYDEYCRRIEEGEDVDVTAFCESHQDCRSALSRCIELHQFLDEHPETLDLLEPIPWPTVGDVFGGKTILEELGRGGVGRVYLAQESELPRQVVLKVSAFDNGEAGRLSRLEHDHIVPIYYIDHDEATGLSAMCMPFQGRFTLHDLFDEVFRDPLRPTGWAQAQSKLFASSPSSNPEDASANSTERYADEVLSLGIAMANALQHCHDQRIYHLDLKPSNILLTSDGTPKLIDFGVSTDDEHREVVGGTKPYMSPEQIRRILYPLAPEVPDPDGKSDVYSLAVILCQLLTGNHPFANVGFHGTEQQLLLCQQAWDPASLRSETELSASLVRVLGDCMSADPDQRPTAAEMSRLLERLLAKPALARRRVLGAGLAGLLLAASMGGFLLRPSPDRRDESPKIHYTKGTDHLVNRDWDQAVDAFSRAITIDPTNAEYLSARASAYCSRGKPNDYLLARVDYTEGYRGTKKPELLACIAYCEAVLRRYGNASANAAMAAAYGFRNSALENIEGYAEITTDRRKANAILREVTEAYPNYQPGWYNRALLDFQPAVNDQASVANAIDCIEQAISIGPEGPMLLYYHAAFMDLQIRNTPDEVPDVGTQRERIRELLVRSLKIGLDPLIISGGPPFLFRSILDSDPELRALIAAGQAKDPMPIRPQITHPLESGPRGIAVITD